MRRRPGCSPTTTSPGSVTRYGRTDTSFSFGAKRMGIPTDGALGQRRARAAALLAMALPGTLLPVPRRGARPPRSRGPARRPHPGPDALPVRRRDPGRDGCRVPLPWAGDAAPYGFSPPARSPKPGCRSLTTGRRSRRPSRRPSPTRRSSSTAARSGCAAQHLTTAGRPLEWLPSRDGVLAFRRGDLVCVVNLASEAIALHWPAPCCSTSVAARRSDPSPRRRRLDPRTGAVGDQTERPTADPRAAQKEPQQ